MTTPKKILSDVDPAATNTALAADDTYVYVARTDHADIVRVDMSGVLTEIVKGTTAYALTVDKTGNLYYADDSGTVFGTKADGTDHPRRSHARHRHRSRSRSRPTTHRSITSSTTR